MTAGDKWRAFVAWLRRGGGDRRQTETDLQLRAAMSETARLAGELERAARRHRPSGIDEITGERRP